MNCEAGVCIAPVPGRCLSVGLLRIRGELAIGAPLRATKLVCGRSVWILTMMQSCASAAKLRAAGPFSPSAWCHVSNRFPPPRIVDRQSPLWMPAASVEQVRR